ncbi:MAG: leucine-rich repeat protein, partial [Blautia sp.]
MKTIEKSAVLPDYYYSPWKEGRGKEEQNQLLLAEELELPHGIEEIGNYTFYGCTNLKRLKFTDSLRRIGGGSFTGCSALRELYVETEVNHVTCIRDVVTETFHEMYVTVYYRDKDVCARLVFPEYYEEGVENTPARILETHFHGSGYRYRQCFTDKKIDYSRYDSLFSVAKVYEKQEILIAMAMGRLLCPYGLSAEREEEYRAYVNQCTEEVGRYFLERKDWHEGLLYLMKKGIRDVGQAERLIGLAADR